MRDPVLHFGFKRVGGEWAGTLEGVVVGREVGLFEYGGASVHFL